MPGDKKKISNEDIRKACEKWLRARGVGGDTLRQRIARDSKRGLRKKRAPRRSKIDKIAEDIDPEHQ